MRVKGMLTQEEVKKGKLECGREKVNCEKIMAQISGVVETLTRG